MSRLGYTFKDVKLLEQALTHRSASSIHNERLEFLGDAILGVIIAEALYIKCPKLREGDLTRIRASLVKGQTLAEISRELGIGPLLMLGSGELKSGGRDRSSILADTLEAIFGAVYLENGFDACKSVILKVYESRLKNIDRQQVGNKDPKTQLQELQQSRHQALPLYNVTDIKGEAHQQTFTINCTLEDSGLSVTAQGSSRRKAEQEAASILLSQIE